MGVGLALTYAEEPHGTLHDAALVRVRVRVRVRVTSTKTTIPPLRNYYS